MERSLPLVFYPRFTLALCIFELHLSPRSNSHFTKLHEFKAMYERAPKPFEKALKPEHTSTLLTVNDLGNPTETTVSLGPSLPSKVARCTIIRGKDGDIATRQIRMQCWVATIFP